MSGPRISRAEVEELTAGMEPTLAGLSNSNGRASVEVRPAPEFGGAAPIGSITTDGIDAYRSRLLAEGWLSRRTVQKVLVVLPGILKLAKRRKSIAENPAEDAERVTVKRSGDFNVLTPEQVFRWRAPPSRTSTPRSSPSRRSPGCAWGSCARFGGATWTSRPRRSSSAVTTPTARAVAARRSRAAFGPCR